MKNLLHISLLLLLVGNCCFAEDNTTNTDMAIRASNLERAANRLIKDQGNRVLGAETARIDDKPIHVIKVLTQHGHVRHYKFDAQTGELLNN